MWISVALPDSLLIRVWQTTCNCTVSTNSPTTQVFSFMVSPRVSLRCGDLQQLAQIALSRRPRFAQESSTDFQRVALPRRQRSEGGCIPSDELWRPARLCAVNVRAGNGSRACQAKGRCKDPIPQCSLRASKG